MLTISDEFSVKNDRSTTALNCALSLAICSAAIDASAAGIRTSIDGISVLNAHNMASLGRLPARSRIEAEISTR